jgi:hypothetical protein
MSTADLDELDTSGSYEDRMQSDENLSDTKTQATQETVVEPSPVEVPEESRKPAAVNKPPGVGRPKKKKKPAKKVDAPPPPTQLVKPHLFYLEKVSGAWPQKESDRDLLADILEEQAEIKFKIFDFDQELGIVVAAHTPEDFKTLEGMLDETVELRFVESEAPLVIKFLGNKKKPKAPEKGVFVFVKGLPFEFTDVDCSNLLKELGTVLHAKKKSRGERQTSEAEVRFLEFPKALKNKEKAQVKIQGHHLVLKKPAGEKKKRKAEAAPQARVTVTKKPKVGK